MGSSYFISGCDIARRMEIINHLNELYQINLQQKKSIRDTYKYMVNMHPARVLSSYSYDWNESPLRSTRIAPVPVLTDAASANESSCGEGGNNSEKYVPLPDCLKTISTIPDHLEFFQMVIYGKTVAYMNNLPSSVIWRGYTTTIQPDFDPSRENLRQTLLSALKNVKLSQSEQKV